jgi:hypothetical protein
VNRCFAELIAGAVLLSLDEAPSDGFVYPGRWRIGQWLLWHVPQYTLRNLAMDVGTGGHQVVTSANVFGHRR